MSAPVPNGAVSETQRTSVPDVTGQEISQGSGKGDRITATDGRGGPSHTPGPWIAKPWIEAGPTDDFTLWRDSYVDATGATVYQPVARVTPHSTLGKAEREANALLVTAAPDLLAALKAADLMLLLLPTRDETEENALEEVRIQNRAAIRKAEGR